ncbi:MAG: hypothetical protein ACN4GW_13805 [Desulforhopalus sp.]
MHQESRSKYNAHLIKLIIAFIVVAIGGLVARSAFIPESMGQFGHYRGTDIEDQKNVPIKLGTNDSCFQCHAPIRVIHKEGVHKTVSCEVCHGAWGKHIGENDQKIGTLPVRQGDEITALCLRCHNKIIQARPMTSIKMIGMPEHLEEQKVRMSHNCSQCHMVHDPLLWIKQAREMMRITEGA